MLSYVNWNVDPVMFSLLGLEVRWYGLCWVLCFSAGLWLFSNFVKREGLSEKIVDSIFWFGTLSTVIGARVGHCLFYEGSYYLDHPWQILNIREGGLASHGAAIGLLVGLWLFSRKNKLPYMWSLDRIMVVVCIGGAFVRFGNLLNSEIYGIETTQPWGFIFSRAGETLPKHPTQIYEAIIYLIGFGVLSWLYFKKDVGRRYPGILFSVGLLFIFLSRFFIEYIKNPQEAFEQGMLLNMGQWLSIPFVLLAISIIIYSITKKHEGSR